MKVQSIRFQPRNRQYPTPQRPSYRPTLETLETRLVPATLTVAAGQMYADIAAAVNAAANSGDIILVAPGTYSAQDINTSKALTIESSGGAGSTTIDCTGGNYFGTFLGSDTIQGFTFENCTNAIGTIEIRGDGTITSCVFTNNDEGSNFNASCINVNGTASGSISNCTFDHNKGFGSVEFAAGATANITDCIFTNNTGEFGSGGIYANTASGTITGCTFTGNAADTTEYGGAIFWVNGSLGISQSTFTNNTSPAGGGAIEIGERRR